MSVDARWHNGEPVRTPLAITSIKAYVTIDLETGDEDIAAFRVRDALLPMVCADDARVERMRPIAEAMARETGVKVKLVEFSVRRDVEVFE